MGRTFKVIKWSKLVSGTDYQLIQNSNYQEIVDSLEENQVLIRKMFGTNLAFEIVSSSEYEKSTIKKDACSIWVMDESHPNLIQTPW